MKDRPNIILIFTDQQNATMMSCTGNPWLHTPAMDELAKRGTRFEHAYCTNPVCVPSRVSIFTGQYPSFFGMRSNNMKSFHLGSYNLNSTLGKVLQQGGYNLYYGGKIHLPQSIHPQAMGFHYFCRDEREELARQSAELIRRKIKHPYCLVVSLINPHDICLMAIRDFPYDELSKFFVEKLKIEQENLDDALKIPDGLSEEEFFKNHCPPLPPNHLPQQDEPEAIRILLQQRPFKWAARTQYTDKQWRLHRWAYCRLTERVDREIGMILEAIDDTKQWDHTVIIFTSDHGDLDGAHAMEHKTAFYQEAIRVPMVICGPNVPSSHIDREHLISNGLDILPTCCSYAHVPIPENLKGLSIPQLWEKPGVPWRKVLRIESEFGRMVMDTRYKYIRYEIGEHSEQLYDLVTDPGETRNHLSDPYNKAIVERMQHYFNQEFADFTLPFIYDPQGGG